ncbi:DUF3553 domain-containing protein [Desulfobulbus rhabdoformis]|uniref:DUF3553 domain-containing protein n=1 Tax=Desulfobulbus rhabdoformis TaxID=34032 RepID=UPI001965E335|nr:DUF3553 domain-containing protein [Desulfobulbus rhabdoformis]MBM9616657.1 DUF3553 domain-containing protein [Desulfobulbus rhabdoformis]
MLNKFNALRVSFEKGETLSGGTMKKNLSKGENVRHKARAEWGIGTIASVDSCGTIVVVFEGNRTFSIAKGINFLIKVDKKREKN